MNYPIKILQFGEGNFLRAFVEYFVEELNIRTEFNGSVAIVKAVPFGDLSALRSQDYQYTLVTRGLRDGMPIDESRMIRSVADGVCAYEDYDRFMNYAESEFLRFIISNTTEAGIVFGPQDQLSDCPPKEFPSKLTKFLYERYIHFGGDRAKGLYILPCELIENNGAKLEQCVLQTMQNWQLHDAFRDWVQNSCAFCGTLVDRIVTGYPGKHEAAQIEKRLGYSDPLMDVCEPFALWVLEDKKGLSDIFPLEKAGVSVIFTQDVKPYRERKVRILNGAHTSTVLAAFLAGKSIVRDCLEDEVIRSYMERCIFNEILPVLSGDKEGGKVFGAAVFERFANPYLDHQLLSIALNSISKWKARVLCSFQDYYFAYGTIPKHLTFSFAALVAFYMGSDINGHSEYALQDNKEVLDFFAVHNARFAAGRYNMQEFVEVVAGNTALWGEDLNQYGNLTKRVTEYLTVVLEKGAYEAMKAL